MDRRADPLLVCGLGALAGLPLASAPLASGVTLIVGGWLLRRVGLRVLLLAWALAAGGALRASIALDEAARAHAGARAVLPGVVGCRLRARVVRSPLVLRQGVARGRERARIDVDVLSGWCEGVPLPPLRLRLYGAPERTARGDELDIDARLGALRLFANPDGSDPRTRLSLSGVSASGTIVALERRRDGAGVAHAIDHARARVRERIEATFSPDLAPLARALVLGETDLHADDRDAFRDSGLAHLLAVSGTHLVLAVVALGRALTALLVRVRRLAGAIDASRIAAAACALLAWLYADFAGGGGSAYRAAAMLSLAMVVRALGRRPCAVRCFSASLLAGALVEPLAIAELSFALSAAATAGLLASREVVARYAAAQPPGLRSAVTAMGATWAATCACTPLLLTIGPELPLLGIAANVLAAPVGELAALPLCLTHALLWWAPDTQQGVAQLASGALAVVRAIAYATSDSPGATVALPPPTSWQLMALSLGGLSVWRATGRRRVLLLAATLLALVGLELSLRWWDRHPDGLRVTVLDVDQGDAILVDFPDGRLMLVDGGGLVGSPIDTGARVILPVLRQRRRSHVDVVVVTHPHPDHYGGLSTALPELTIGEVWVSDAGEPDGHGSWSLLVKSLRARGIPLRLPPDLCDGSHAFGASDVKVLAPCPAPDAMLGANDNSLVLKITLGERAALLLGDAEQAAERALVARPPHELRADFMKVGHHGSRTSTSPALVQAVRPAAAAISCGVRNRFGHPHPETLWSLDGAGVVTLRSDRGGAIVWQTDGRTAHVQQPHGQP
jgi:competence protein ComEC